MKPFYSHLLIHYEKIVTTIERLPLEKKEKHHAKSLIDRTLHYEAIDLLLEHVPPAHHDRMLERIERMPDDRVIIDLATKLTGKDIAKILRDHLTTIQLHLLEDLCCGERG